MRGDERFMPQFGAFEQCLGAALIKPIQAGPPIEMFGPLRYELHSGVDFRPLIDENAGDVQPRPDWVQTSRAPHPAEVSCGYCTHRELAAGHRPTCPTRMTPTAFPEPWTTCPKCHLDGWHLIERRSTPGVIASWPDSAAPHWLRTCVWCWAEWREPAPPDDP